MITTMTKSLSLVFLLLPSLFVPLVSSAPTSSTSVSLTPTTQQPAQRRQAAQQLSCKDVSTRTINWLAKSFQFSSSVVFSTPSHRATANATVDFSLSNPGNAPGSTVACHADSSQAEQFFYGDTWFTCESESENESRNGTLHQAQFQYDHVHGVLVAQQSWSCLDEDGYTYSFTASGSANLTTLECSDTKWQNPSWTAGQLYSTDLNECDATQDVVIALSDISASS